MSRIVGIEIGAARANAVLCDGSGNVVAQRTLSFDLANPAALVTELRAHFGKASRIYVTLGMAYVDVKRVELPMKMALRRRIVALEPDRFFAHVAGPLAVGGCDDFIFATNAEPLENLVGALEQWAPVYGVEPVPVSLARAMADAAFVVEAVPGEAAFVEIVDHHLAVVRRTSAVASLPEGRAVADYVCATAATRAHVAEMLLSPLLEKKISGRLRGVKLRRAAMMMATAAAMAAAVDVARARTLTRLQEQTERAVQRAQPAAALRARMDAAQRENNVVTQGAAVDLDPLSILATLSERLPADAVVLNMRASGAAWQIEGTARDAAAIVPLLDQIPQFRDVRMLSPSSRFQEAGRTYETFAVAFHAGRN